MRRTLVTVSLLVLLSACAQSPEPSPMPDPGAKYATVRTFFATDRNATGNPAASKAFGAARSSAVSYGTADVSIPRIHEMGRLESPSILRLEFREDPEKHIVLLAVNITSADQFFVNVSERLRTSQKSEAFVFVHGFNVTFEDAARRTAQISYDLGFKGVPVFYSWPSQGETLKYIVDEQNMEWAQANLKTFLLDFLTRSNAENVHLIAHSMGTRGLTRAVASLLEEHPTLRPRLKQIILAAPDIDADVFRRDIAPAMLRAGQSVTVYASSEDVAIEASRKVHGSPRAGDTGPGLVVLPDMDTVDATGVDTGFLKHSYYGDRESILADMFYLIGDGKRAKDRFRLNPVTVPAGTYWKFQR